MRYQQTLDGSAFSPPSTYLATPSAEVADMRQLYVDYDVYALIDNTLRRYHLEKYDGGFALDGAAGRRGHAARPRLPARDWLRHRPRRGGGSTSTTTSTTGSWASTRRTAPTSASGLPDRTSRPMDDVRGMYVIPGKVVKKQREPDTLVWVTPEGLYSSVLTLD